MNELGIKITEVESIVLSHGHMDHHGALKNILKQKAEPIPLIVHPDVFLKKRFIILPDGKKISFSVLQEDTLQEMGSQIIKNKLPSLLATDLALVTGEIERTTDFEKGMLNAYLERAGKTEPDRVLDDQAIVIHLKGKGLVIITGCAHSGIINTIQFAQKLTEISSIHAIIGGFHLSGPKFEPIIPRTLAELKAIHPAIICPMHCTGWKATMEIARGMPQQFVLSSVGTKLIL
jgi:7,8-dihydropterin-6-yl-methyl-4-(beta-D-ribofuranosyl)aminobenzene 5'-phosphate synthase